MPKWVYVVASVGSALIGLQFLLVGFLALEYLNNLKSTQNAIAQDLKKVTEDVYSLRQQVAVSQAMSKDHKLCK